MSRRMMRLMLATAGLALIACPAVAQEVAYGAGTAIREESVYVAESREVRVYVNGRLVDGDAAVPALGYERAATVACGAPVEASHCPPGVGEIHLPDSFFIGGGGVGPVMAWVGGGGGYWAVGTTARAGGVASAYARAASSVRVSGGAGQRLPRSGCGCH